MSEKLCLQWNDFQENIKSAFGNLREDNDFVDVTLVSEDGQQVEAHKVILAASSPTFQKLLAQNKHPHPLIYLRGMKAHDLLAILDFLYQGEANVFQDNLDSFLAIAKELQLEGLMANADDKSRDFEDNKKPLPSYDTSGNIPETSPRKQLSNRETHKPPEGNSALAIPANLLGNFDELEERVRSMMEKSQNKTAGGKHLAYNCTVCGKEGRGTYIKDHIETNHLEGVKIPCNLCGNTFRSRKRVLDHKARQHNQEYM